MVPWWWPFGRVPEIGPEALAGDGGRDLERFQVVDVRTGAEFQRGHVPGARWVPIHRLNGRLPALGLDRGQPVALVCKTGHRSRAATRLLRRAGYDARNLAGGIDAWRRAGLPEQQQD